MQSDWWVALLVAEVAIGNTDYFLLRYFAQLLLMNGGRINEMKIMLEVLQISQASFTKG